MWALGECPSQLPDRPHDHCSDSDVYHDADRGSGDSGGSDGSEDSDVLRSFGAVWWFQLVSFRVVTSRAVVEHADIL